MKNYLLRVFAPPKFGDPDKNRMASILNTMLLVMLASSVIFGPILTSTSSNPQTSALVYVGLDICLLIALFLMRRGWVRSAGWLFIISAWATLTLVTLFVYGGLSNPLIAGYIVVIVAAGLLMGNRTGIFIAALCYLTIIGFFLLNNAGFIFGNPANMTPVQSMVFYTLLITLTVALTYITNNSISVEIKRAQRHQYALIERSDELQSIRDTLELRVVKRTEEILQQSQLFKALVEHYPIAVVTIDLDNKIVSCNPAFENLFGYAQSEVIGQDIDTLVTTETIQQEARTYTQRVIDGESVHCTGVRRRKDNSLVNVEIFGVPIIVDGEQKGILALYHNISEQKQAEEALRKSEEKYRDLVENIDNIIYATDEKGILTYISPAVENYLGYQIDEVIGSHFRDFIHTNDVPAITKNFEAILSGQISGGEYLLHTKNGDTRWMHTSSRPITVEDKVVGIQGVLSDITERKKAEAALIESEEKFRTLAEQSPNMVFINKDGRIVYANMRCVEVMGYTQKEFYNPDFNFINLIAQIDRDLVMNNFKKHSNGIDLDPCEYTLVTRYGEEIASIVTTRLVNYEGETAILGTVTDITERKRAEERLTYIATHDSLTGLPNRSLFYDRLQHAVHNAKRNGLGVAVAFLDLDGFKSVNDTYGHEKGDFLLQDVASRLNGCVRESDSVARLGGDEFTFIFEKVHDPGDAITIAEKIIESLSKPFKINSELVYITASIGISLYPNDGEDTSELIKKADTAMYAAKDLAQNSYKLYSSIS